MFQHSMLRYLSSAAVFAAPAESGSAAPAANRAKPSVPTAGKSPFAHLARNAPHAAEDDKEEDKDKDASAEDEECEEDEESEDDKKGKKGKKAKKAKKAEEDDDDTEASEEDDDDEDMKEEGDDDSDKDDDKDAKARAARGRERGRIQAIVTSEAGKANPVAAMELACGSSMSRKQCISLLQAMGTPAATKSKPVDGLRDRMANVQQPDVGAGNGEVVEPNLAQKIINAGKKARGEKV